MGQLLDRYSGITETLHQDGESDFTIKMTADVQPVIEQIKRIRQVSDGKSKSGELYHVARVPEILVRQWNIQYGCDVTAKENFGLFERLLDSPEFKAFRIYQGKL